MLSRIKIRAFSWTLLLLVSLTTLAEARHRKRDRIVTMTQNLYVGADILRILAVPPDQIPIVVAETLQTVAQNRPDERMEAMAKIIDKHRPHLIGIQEAFQILTQTPGDVLIGNPIDASDVLVDYLALLMGALERRGLDYRVVSTFMGIDVELPAFGGVDAGGAPLFFDARVVDRDVILARGDVETANPGAVLYTHNLPIPIPGVDALESRRGYTSVDAWFEGQRHRFVNTHLEVDFEGEAGIFQMLQAQELLGVLASESDPLIVVCDFNSGPDQEATATFVPPYQMFAAAEFTDAWKKKKGDTCCRDETLDNAKSKLDRRIDLVWIRNAETLRKIHAKVVGHKKRDRTPSKLWPSDHGGVVARFDIR